MKVDPDGKSKLQKLLDDNNLSIDLVEYVKYKAPVTCKCRKCGNVWATYPRRLKEGQGRCKICDNKSPSVEELQKELNSLNKNMKVISKSLESTPKLYTMECLICGNVSNRTRSSAVSNGCALCSGKLKSSKESLQEIVKDKGIEVLGEYINRHTNIECRCKVCDLNWSPRPNNLKYGMGCPSCCKRGFDPNKSGTLYYLRVDTDFGRFWKIGITNYSIEERFCPEDRTKITVLYTYNFNKGAVASNAETSILRLFSKYKANIKVLKSGGNSELFIKDILQMDHLGE